MQDPEEKSDLRVLKQVSASLDQTMLAKDRKAWIACIRTPLSLLVTNLPTTEALSKTSEASGHRIWGKQVNAAVRNSRSSHSCAVALLRPV